MNERNVRVDGCVKYSIARLCGSRLIKKSCPARLLENRSERRGHWIRLRVVDPRLGGRDAFGARVEVKTADARRVARVAAASSYLSSSDPRVHFGLGRAERVEQIEVLWPDGLRERFGAQEVDRDVVLSRGAGTAVP